MWESASCFSWAICEEASAAPVRIPLLRTNTTSQQCSKESTRPSHPEPLKALTHPGELEKPRSHASITTIWLATTKVPLPLPPSPAMASLPVTSSASALASASPGQPHKGQQAHSVPTPLGGPSRVSLKPSIKNGLTPKPSTSGHSCRCSSASDAAVGAGAGAEAEESAAGAMAPPPGAEEGQGVARGSRRDLLLSACCGAAMVLGSSLGGVASQGAGSGPASSALAAEGAEGAVGDLSVPAPSAVPAKATCKNCLGEGAVACKSPALLHPCSCNAPLGLW